MTNRALGAIFGIGLVGVGAHPALGAPTQKLDSVQRTLAQSILNENANRPGGVSQIGDYISAGYPSDRLIKYQEPAAVSKTYKGLVSKLNLPSRQKDTSLILNVHGMNALGVATSPPGEVDTRVPLDNIPQFKLGESENFRSGTKIVKGKIDGIDLYPISAEGRELASMPRLLNDIPDRYNLVVLGQCNPRKLLGLKDITVAQAMASHRELDHSKGTLRVFNLNNEFTIKNGKLVSLNKVSPILKKSGLAEVVSPNYVGLSMSDVNINRRSAVESWVLAGEYTKTPLNSIKENKVFVSNDTVLKAKGALNLAKSELETAEAIQVASRFVPKASIPKSPFKLPVEVPIGVATVSAGGAAALAGKKRKLGKRPIGVVKVGTDPPFPTLPEPLSISTSTPTLITSPKVQPVSSVFSSPVQASHIEPELPGFASVPLGTPTLENMTRNAGLPKRSARTLGAPLAGSRLDIGVRKVSSVGASTTKLGLTAHEVARDILPGVEIGVKKVRAGKKLGVGGEYYRPDISPIKGKDLVSLSHPRAKTLLPVTLAIHESSHGIRERQGTRVPGGLNSRPISETLREEQEANILAKTLVRKYLPENLHSYADRILNAGESSYSAANEIYGMYGLNHLSLKDAEAVIKSWDAAKQKEFGVLWRNKMPNYKQEYVDIAIEAQRATKVGKVSASEIITQAAAHQEQVSEMLRPPEYVNASERFGGVPVMSPAASAPAAERKAEVGAAQAAVASSKRKATQAATQTVLKEEAEEVTKKAFNPGSWKPAAAVGAIAVGAGVVALMYNSLHKDEPKGQNLESSNIVRERTPTKGNTRLTIEDADINMRDVDEMFLKKFKEGFR